MQYIKLCELYRKTSITHITLSEDPLSFPKGHHLPPDAGG
jgi:hypothetical protein